MNLRVTALSMFSAAVLASTAFSTPVTIEYIGPANGTTETVKINNGSYKSVYTGLYNITVDGAAYQTFCIDPLGDIERGDTWTASHLSASEITAGNGDLFTNIYPNSGRALEKYAMINYLADKSFYLYTDSPDSRLNSVSERSELSLLYWEIAMDYSGTYNSLNLNKGKFISTSIANNQTLQGLLLEAYNHRLDQLTMSIYSSTDNPSQEFLAFKTSSVPEPGMACLLLLGFSCLGLSGFIRRKGNKS